MKKIGFASKFYTLWDYRRDAFYVQDAYGNYHLAGYNEFYTYLQNISTDLATVKSKYPGVSIDEDLRGRSHSFEVRGKEDLRPLHIIWFGKYKGMELAEVAAKDWDYILWLHGNNGRYEKHIEAMPAWIDYQNKLNDGKRAFESTLPELHVGQEIEIIGTSNGWNPYQNEDGTKEAWFSATYNDCQFSVRVSDYEQVCGMYPYIMPMVNSKYCRTKNKSFKIQVKHVEHIIYGNNKNGYTNNSIIHI